MRFVLLTAWKELQRARRDPLVLGIWLGIPLFLTLMLNLVFGGGGGGKGPIPKGRLLVADEDRTFVSNIVTGVFKRDQLAQMVEVEKVQRAEGRARIDRGDGSALLIIPAGFQAAFLNRRPVRLQLFTNPAERILPQVIAESLGTLVEGGFYVQRAEGGGAFDLRGMGRRIAELRKSLDPPPIELETAVVVEKKQPKGFGALFLPSMLFMSVWMMAGALAGEIWKERSQGTLRRVAAAPVRLEAFLAGRVLFVAALYCAVTLGGLAAAQWLGGVPVANLPLAVAWVVAAGVTFYLLALLASMAASNPHAAQVLGNLVAFPLALVGGCFFPFEIMPGWMAAIGRLTPNGWAVTQFTSIISGPVNAKGLAGALAATMGVAGLAFWLAVRRMKRSFAV